MRKRALLNAPLRLVRRSSEPVPWASDMRVDWTWFCGYVMLCGWSNMTLGAASAAAETAAAVMVVTLGGLVGVGRARWLVGKGAVENGRRDVDANADEHEWRQQEEARKAIVEVRAQRVGCRG